MNVLIFIAACYGMTMILVYGKIFDSIRPSHHFFKCCMCMGFWVGMFNWTFMKLPMNAFTASCVSAGTSYFLSRLVDDDGILIKVKNKTE